MIGYIEVKTIVWICILVFLVTAVLAVLALVGIIKFPYDHEKYTRTLFRVIIFEIALITVGSYAALLRNPGNYAPAEVGNLDSKVTELEKNCHQRPRGRDLNGISFASATVVETMHPINRRQPGRDHCSRVVID